MTTFTTTRQPRRRMRQAGFGLIELMVALAISLFVLGAVLSIYLNMKNTFNTQGQFADLQDSQRLVVTMMTTTIQSAGYFVNPRTDTQSAALPAATVTGADGSSSVFAAGQFIVGSGNGSGRAANSDAVTVRYQTANNDGLMNCQGATNTSGATTIYTNRFAVNANNELTCTVGTGSPVTLAGNVDKMSILYGVDTDGDVNNAIDTYLPASAITDAGLWANVYTAQLKLVFLNTTASKPGAPVTMPQPLVQTINLMNRR